MNWRILLIVPALAVGVVLFRIQTASDPGTAAVAPPSVVPAAVRVRTVEPRPLRVAVSGFGRVRPVRTWEAISRVDGRVVEMLPGLAVGTVVPEGAVLIRVDPRDYEIARDRAEAGLATAKAQLAELNAQEGSLGDQLDLERQIEDVARSELQRRTTLAARGTIAESSLEQGQRDLIAQQRRVVELENQIALVPVQRSSAEATVRSREVELEEAERALSNVVVTAPFEGRVTEADASEGEYVRPGDRLAALDWTGAVEVAAEVQPGEMQRAMALLVPDLTALPTAVLADRNAAERALASAGIEAVVRSTDAAGFEWPARIVRTEGAVDAQTGTFGIVVRVDDPASPDLATRRPPLNSGSFVEVVFRAEAAPALTVPRAALVERGDGTHLYLADAEDRLARVPVEVSGRIEDEVVVSGGIAPGARVVLAPPRPAILRQPLAVVEGEGPSATMAAAAE